jgi:hypothetical protein
MSHLKQEKWKGYGIVLRHDYRRGMILELSNDISSSSVSLLNPNTNQKLVSKLDG